MEKVMYSEKPTTMTYMALPNGMADVWLRGNIESVIDEDGGEMFQADETYFRTSLTRQEVENNFTALLYGYDEIQAKMTKVVQDYMGAKVQERGYDGILSVCSYINTGNLKFDAEGEACRKWRSAVWEKCYDMVSEIKTGERVIPTEDELIAELPPLEW